MTETHTPTPPWNDPDHLLELFKAGTPEEQRFLFQAVANLACTTQQLIDDIRGTHDTDH